MSKCSGSNRFSSLSTIRYSFTHVFSSRKAGRLTTLNICLNLRYDAWWYYQGFTGKGEIGKLAEVFQFDIIIKKPPTCQYLTCETCTLQVSHAILLHVQYAMSGTDVPHGPYRRWRSVAGKYCYRPREMP